jgi:hypothetical protein
MQSRISATCSLALENDALGRKSIQDSAHLTRERLTVGRSIIVR